MMHILQIIKGLDIGGQNGGSEKFGLELGLSLRAQGLKVSLCAFYQHGTKVEKEWMDRLQRAGVTLFFGLDVPSGNPWPGFQRLASFCRIEEIDIIHSHFQVGSLAAVYLKVNKANCLIMRTSHITKEWGGGVVAFISRLVFTWLLFPIVFNSEVGVSRAIVEQLNRRLVARFLGRHAICIYNALTDSVIDGAEDRVRTRWATNPSQNKFVLGSVGRLTLRKGYRFLLNAIAELTDEIPNLQLILVGDGEERLALQQQATRMGLADRVEFLGQRADVLTFLQQMDLFVLPSLQEGLPTVILESISCGTPVVATNIPGTKELIQDGENGWLASPGDSNALGECIQHAYYHLDLRRTYSLRAVTRLEHFRMQEITRKYIDLYVKLSSRI